MRDVQPTPVTFSPAEAREIREVLASHGKLAPCPLCGGTLNVRGPVEGGGSLGPVWRVDCEPCHRTAFITEVPGTRRAQPRR